MTDCKYDLWKSAVNELQQRRDILFCPCGHCTMARRAWHMRTVDNRPKVNERLEKLKTKPAPKLDAVEDETNAG